MFFMLEVLPVSLLYRGQTLILCSPPHMMDYDVYMHDLLVLVIIFGASPRSYKTESGWKTCCVLGVGNITGPPRDKVHTSHV